MSILRALLFFALIAVVPASGKEQLRQANFVVEREGMEMKRPFDDGSLGFITATLFSVNNANTRFLLKIRFATQSQGNGFKAVEVLEFRAERNGRTIQVYDPVSNSFFYEVEADINDIEKANAFAAGLKSTVKMRKYTQHGLVMRIVQDPASIGAQVKVKALIKNIGAGKVSFAVMHEMATDDETKTSDFIFSPISYIEGWGVAWPRDAPVGGVIGDYVTLKPGETVTLPVRLYRWLEFKQIPAKYRIDAIFLCHIVDEGRKLNAPKEYFDWEEALTDRFDISLGR